MELKNVDNGVVIANDPALFTIQNSYWFYFSISNDISNKVYDSSKARFMRIQFNIENGESTPIAYPLDSCAI